MEQKNIIAALVKAQLKIRPPKKSGLNPMFKSRYATFDDIMVSISKPLAEEGLVVSHTHKKIEGEIIHIVRITHVSGEFMESEFFLKVDKPTMQGLASANTYAKRQAVCNLLSLAGDEDDDANVSEQESFKSHKKGVGREKSSPETTINADQCNQLEGYIGGDPEISERILRAYKVESLSLLPSHQFTSIVNGIHGIKKKRAEVSV